MGYTNLTATKVSRSIASYLASNFTSCTVLVAGAKHRPETRTWAMVHLLAFGRSVRRRSQSFVATGSGIVDVVLAKATSTDKDTDDFNELMRLGDQVADVLEQALIPVMVYGLDLTGLTEWDMLTNNEWHTLGLGTEAVGVVKMEEADVRPIASTREAGKSGTGSTFGERPAKSVTVSIPFFADETAQA